MASIVDNSTALEVMKSANDDFIELILKLKALFNGMEPVTFNMGKYSITVNTILELISSYKDGRFDEIILGGQTTGKQVKLSVDSNGNLCVTDTDGYAVSVSCSKLIASTIENCIAKQVTVDGAYIRSIVGKVSVTGGNVSFGSMTFDNLETSNLKSKNIRTENLTVKGFLSSDGLAIYGARKFVPKKIRSIFYRNGAPVNKAASLIRYKGDIHISGVDPVWNFNAGGNSLTPADLGFPLATSISQLQAAMAVPDMIMFRGDTQFSDFDENLYWLFVRTNAPKTPTPTNLVAYVILPNSSLGRFVEFDTDEYSFPALMAFPTGSYTTAGDGTWVLASFSQTDLGKEVYYRTMENEWRIYRTMVVRCNAQGVPTEVTFENLSAIPPYTCARYIVNIIDTTETVGSISTRKVIYVLESA